MTLKLFSRLQIVKDSSVLAGGAGMGQVLMLLSYPLLTRLYSPETFGVLAIAVALAGIFSHAGGLRYELAIHLPVETRDGYAVLVVALLSSLLVAVALFAVILLAEVTRAHLHLSWGLGAIVWLVPILVLAECAQRALTYWGARQGQMRTVAIASIVQAIGNVTTALVLGVLGAGALGLVLGQVIGPLLAALLLAVFTVLRWADRRPIAGQELAQQARRYQEMPRFGVPQGLAYSIGQNIPHLLLASFFGLEVAGVYLLAQKVMRHPADLVAEALRQAFLRRIRDWRTEGRIARSMLGAMAGLMLMSLPGAAIIVVGGPWLFDFVFGPGWGVAGVYARYLLVFVLSGLVTMPAIAAIPALGMQRFHSAYEIVATLCRTLGLVAGYALGSELAAIGFYAAVGAAGHAVLAIHVVRYARAQDRQRVAVP